MALSVRVHSGPPLSPVPTVGTWLSRVPRRRRTTAATPAPLGSAATYVPTYVYAQLSLARPPATRAVSTPFGPPNVYFSARSDFRRLCYCRELPNIRNGSNPFSKLSRSRILYVPKCHVEFYFTKPLRNSRFQSTRVRGLNFLVETVTLIGLIFSFRHFSLPTASNGLFRYEFRFKHAVLTRRKTNFSILSQF